ncbi:MAG: outer membrane protein assembly factor [Ectothiorhodospiraceae bacterium]|nr:outer membrane protein assembly factor [Ectothiorhodospiraceae bacterium]
MIIRPAACATIRLLLLGALLLCATTGTAEAELTVRVEGIDGALRDNVVRHIGTPLSDDPRILRRFAARAEENAQQGLQALGYYHATVTTRLEGEPDSRVLHVQVEPGEPTRIRRLDIRLEGAAESDRAFLDVVEQIELREGQILHHGRYESAKRSLESTALTRGYFDGRFQTSRVAVNRQQREADITLHYVSGPRYRLGVVRFPDGMPVTDSLMQRLVPFSEGDPYHSGSVARLNRNLLNSGYFSEVRVRPQEAVDEVIPVDADLTAARPNRMDVGLGYATDVGPRLRLGWRKPYVTRDGHSLRADTEISEVRQSLSGVYSMPLDPPLEHQLQFVGGWQREKLDETDSEKLTAGIQRQRQLTRGWQQTLFLRWEREQFEVGGRRDETTLTLPGTTLSRTRSRGGMDPHWGDRQTATVTATHPELGSDLQLSRLRLETRWLRSYGRHRGLVRGEVGALFTENFDRTPVSLRFAAGGDQSVRGFAYQSLGPRDEDGDLVRGRYLAVASAEYGYQVAPNWRLATFYDVGNAFDDWGDSLKEGAGFGVRWISPVGPIRLDFAWGISERGTPFRLHFSMGPEI